MMIPVCGVRTVAAIICLLFYSQIVVASASIQSIGNVFGQPRLSAPTAISGDGNVVVGYGPSLGGIVAMRWDAANGTMQLTDGYATGANYDGTIIVGYHADGFTEGFRWDQGTGTTYMPDLPGGNIVSAAYGVSADGAVVVGSSSSTYSGSSYSEPCIWSSDGVQGIGTLPGSTTGTSRDISADGSVIIGTSSGQAFRWTQTTGMMGLGILNGHLVSYAEAVSADGNYVVGASVAMDHYEAVRWDEMNGLVGLGDLSGGSFDSRATGVSGDGTIVVGRSATAAGQEAFIWTSSRGMQRLEDYLTRFGADMSGWRLESAVDISDDGSAIVGYGVNPAGHFVTYYATIPTHGALGPVSLVLLIRNRKRRCLRGVAT